MTREQELNRRNNTMTSRVSRGAPVVAVTDGQTDVSQFTDHVLDTPATLP